jgi:pimeloyl-ACP methyl ester carboxylesterase
MKTDNSLTLPDGRKLAYAEFGQPDGHPVLYCHAAPSARLEPLVIGKEVFRQYGLRVIAPDRPGMGGSDFQPKREFSDWVEDVVFLVDALGLEKFSVVGISGGSGYAAVCAVRIPERLSKVVIASGPWKIDKEVIKTIGFPMNAMWNTALRMPFFLPVAMKMMIKFMTQEPKDNSKKNAAPPNDIMPAIDHAAMSQPERMAVYLQTLRETVKQGIKGAAWDIRMYVREWDFDPAEIQVPLVLFHGGLDRNVPLALVEEMANSLPGAHLVAYSEDGHVSTYLNHFYKIAQSLLPEA